MALHRLPDELLRLIALETLPEGFEALAVTSQRLYSICRPFIQEHNDFKRRYRVFSLRRTTNESGPSSSVDLIKLIARCPRIGRYIQEADLSSDGRMSSRTDNHSALLNDIDIIKLFSSSPYLAELDIPWPVYVQDAIASRSYRVDGYCQHATALLLTLLPNLRTIALPDVWPDYSSNEVLWRKVHEFTLTRALQPSSTSPRPSLSAVTKAQIMAPIDLVWCLYMETVFDLLALPQLEEFHGRNCVGALSDIPNTSFNLRTVSLVHSRLSYDGLRNFLTLVPSLKSLTYSHTRAGFSNLEAWDVVDFLEVVMLQVGSHLEELSVSTASNNVRVAARRKALMDGFRCLRKLELGINLVGQITARYLGTADGNPVRAHTIFSSLIPQTVQCISWIPRPPELSEPYSFSVMDIEDLFDGLRIGNNLTTPLLHTVHVKLLPNEMETNIEHWTKVRAQTEEANITFRFIALDL